MNVYILQVERIIIHPGFNTQHSQHDIALLRLSTHVLFTPYIQPACLPSREFDAENTIGTVVGWGRTERGRLADGLKQANMHVVPRMECLESNRDFYGQFLYDGNFCAGYKNLTSPTACAGDSGGGLYFKIRESWVVGGLVSIGVKTENGCDHDNYVLFTDVHKYITWIMDNQQR